MKENILIEKIHRFRRPHCQAAPLSHKRKARIGNSKTDTPQRHVNRGEYQRGPIRAEQGGFYFKASDRLKGNSGNGVLASYPSKIGLP